MSSWLEYCNKRLWVTLLLGFSSGLPLSLSGPTLATWYATTHISIKHIACLTLVGFPYLFKFLWAPLLDRYTLFNYDRRRTWMLGSQLAIVAILIAMAYTDPHVQAVKLALLACALAFCSATQDIAIDAYRAEILQEDERAFGAAMNVNGYRLAMLVSGGYALIHAHRYGWQQAYLLMAALMGIGILASLCGPRTPASFKPTSIFAVSYDAIVEFVSRPHAYWILALLVLYKLGDAFAGSLLQPFLLQAIKVSLDDIGSVVKLVGFAATLLGTISSAILTPKLGYYRSLLYFGLLHCLTYLCYLSLYWFGPDKLALGGVIFLENFANGLVISSLVGLMMALCNTQFTAFQYASLSALSSLARVTIGPFAGHVVATYGYQELFVAAILLALPGLVVLGCLNNKLDQSLTRQVTT